MTAPIASSANLNSGLVQLSNVTNTYGGYFESDGSAYNLVLPWQADKFEWYNYTKFATNDNNLQGVWLRDFPAGNTLIINRGTTTLTSTLEATDGVTIANTSGGFTAEQHTITGITTATPAVVTSASHGFSTGDRVVITKVIGTIGSELNNNTYVVNVVSANTFSLYDVYGNPITTVGSYTSSGQATLTEPSLGIVDSPVSYILTLGTAIVGANSDIIYFVASQFNNYVNIGDTA